MLERWFNAHIMRHRLDYPFYLGILLTGLAFLTSNILFYNLPQLVGISTMFFTVILATPIFSEVLKNEEKNDRNKNASFIQKHKVMFDFILYFFAGVLLAFFILSLLAPNKIFSTDHIYGNTVEIVQKEGLPPPPHKTNVQSLFTNNIVVSLFCFGLAVFFGSGVLLLLVLNASIFAASIAKATLITINNNPESSQFLLALCKASIFTLHAYPELIGYAIAAIAGGILSKAIRIEKFGSTSFKEVVLSSFGLFGIGGVILLGAAFIEAKLTQPLLADALVCTTSNWILYVFLSGLVVVVILGLEYARRTHSHHKRHKHLHLRRKR